MHEFIVPSLLLYLRGVRQPAAEIGVRVRRAFERLGITYVKLGQFLAMRFDILPEDVCHGERGPRIAPPLHFHLAMAGRLCVHVY